MSDHPLKYGVWSRDDLIEELWSLGPAADSSNAEPSVVVEDQKRRGVYAGFVEAVRLFLLDDTMSFREKADLVAFKRSPLSHSYDHLQHLWKLIAPEEPWPLAHMPRPTDE